MASRPLGRYIRSRMSEASPLPAARTSPDRNRSRYAGYHISAVKETSFADVLQGRMIGERIGFEFLQIFLLFFFL